MADGREKERGVAVRERERPEHPMLWPEDLDRFTERFFERAMRGFDLWPWRRFRHPRLTMWHREEWLPNMDVFEDEGNIVVRVDLPGISREDVDVAVEGDMLVVRGQRKEEKEIKEEAYYCAERSVGDFYRAFRLPEGVNTDAIDANYQDGVLEVKIPRPAAPEAKKLKVVVK